MPQSDQIRDLQRPPTRSHQTNVTSRKDKKEKREKPKPSKSTQTCPGTEASVQTLVSIPIRKLLIFQHVFSSLFDVSSTSFSRWFPFTCWFSFWWRWIWLFWTYESSWLNPESSHVVIFYIYNGAVLIHCRHIPMTFQPKTIQKARNHILSNWRRSTDHGPRILVRRFRSKI